MIDDAGGGDHTEETIYNLQKVIVKIDLGGVEIDREALFHLLCLCRCFVHNFDPYSGTRGYGQPLNGWKSELNGNNVPYFW